MSMGESIGLKNLQQALARWTGQNMDVGVATGGTNTTADDTLKDWPVNKWAGGQVRIIKANGQEYDRAITSNTATQLTFAGLPGAIVVAAGDIYSIKTSAAVTDITDRWARLLGQVDLARVLGAVLAHANPVIARLTDGAAFLDPRAINTIGGTAQTGADWTPLLQRLNVNLSTIANEATLVKLIPIAKAAIFNTALPAAEANWIGADITPTNSPSYIRIYVCVSVAGILRVARTIGGVPLTEDLNAGNNLVAGAAYMFTVPWRTGDGIDIRYSVTAGTINRLLIDEIGGAE